VEAVQLALKVYSKSIYSEDLSLLLKRLQPARSRRLSAVWARLTSASYRQSRVSILRLRTAGKAPVARLLTELEEIQRQAEQWAAKAQGRCVPCEVGDFPAHKTACDQVFADADDLASILGRELDSLDLAQYEALLGQLKEDDVTPHQIPKLTHIENALDAAGIGKLIAEIRETRPESVMWPDIFRYSWIASTLDAVSENDAEVRGFKGITHDRYVREFDQLDEERIAVAADRVRRAHGLRAVEAMNAHPEQQHLIKAEAAKIGVICRCGGCLRRPQTCLRRSALVGWPVRFR